MADAGEEGLQRYGEKEGGGEVQEDNGGEAANREETCGAESHGDAESVAERGLGEGSGQEDDICAYAVENCNMGGAGTRPEETRQRQSQRGIVPHV